MEIWKGLIYQSEDYSERFEISNQGNLRNSKTNHIYKLNICKTGYYSVCVSLGSRKNKKLIKIHRGVAETFIPNKYNYPIINHIDGNKLNNKVENLEWCTQAENLNHAIKIGLKTYEKIKGANHPKSKLSLEDIEYIRKNYIPNDKSFGCRMLAKKFNVSHNTISNIVNNVTYIQV